MSVNNIQFLGVLDIEKLFPKVAFYKNLNLGCRRRSLSNHSLDFIQGDSTLFVTFFPADMATRNATPWGARFLRTQGHSILGIIYKEKDWYRSSDLHRFFRSSELSEFFKGFEKVVFYGASKGGYGALAFSEVVHAPIVIAIAPQSTMDPRIVPWDGRFVSTRTLNWDGDFRDAVDSLRDSGTYYLCYDPLEREDASHVRRLRATGRGRIIEARLPLAGHLVPTALLRYGILKPFVVGCRDETMDERSFAALARRRREHHSYYVALASARRNRNNLQFRRKCLEIAEAMSPLAPEYRFARAQLNIDQGQIEESLRELELLKQAHPTLSKQVERLSRSASVGVDYRKRWQDLSITPACARERLEVFSGWIAQPSIVLDIGCGRQELRNLLPPGSQYLPCDLYSWSTDCKVIDFRRGLFPEFSDFAIDWAIIAGVLEYIPEPLVALKWALEQSPRVAFSYAALDVNENIGRRVQVGFLNHLKDTAIQDIVQSVGGKVVRRQPWRRQYLYWIERTATVREAPSESR